MAISKFDKSNLKNVREELDAALVVASKALGIHLKVGTIRFDQSTFTVKVEGAVLTESGEAALPEARHFRDHAGFLGLKPEDLGREFAIGAKRYSLQGYMPRKHKFPFLCKDLTLGKMMCLPQDAVQLALGVQPNSFRYALDLAKRLMRSSPELEPTSALKQAASDYGIQYGGAMSKFVEWANKELTGVSS